MADLSAKARIRIRRKPAEVFAAFADAESMSKFWFTRRDAGLKQGESLSWFLGREEEADSFEVHVRELDHAKKIVIEWPNEVGNTQVAWLFEETEAGDTIVTIEETGFSGSNDSIIEQVLDSTGGFNQVILAAKALLEHDVELNVVTDHV